jgi:ribulose-phosphate 3-epimerase
MNPSDQVPPRSTEIAPSILSADFSRLGEQVGLVEPYAGRVHVDVMDGHFVPNLSIGPAIVASLRPCTKLPLEVHLMVTDPAKFVGPFARAGADRLIFHVEAEGDPLEIAGQIRAAGCSAGIALNPETPWEAAARYAEEVDLVLTMTVHPGFGGQGFIEEVLGKVGEVRRALIETGSAADVEVDGGIDPATAARARKAGANVFVAGHAIFRAEDPAAAAQAIAHAVGAPEGVNR